MLARNKKNTNVLSLDPMYSNLHIKIAKLYNGEKYALLSSWAMKIYLRGYKCSSINKMVLDSLYTKDDLLLVDTTETHYKSLIAVKERRSLNLDEKIYMAKYCSFLRAYLIEKKIGLVLLHNDLRWHHALAIMVCKSLDINYLVTEQGLFRPTTTIIDRCGVNAYSSLMKMDVLARNEMIDDKGRGSVKHDHNSIISMIYFAFFLILYNIESVFNTRIPYQHNTFCFSKYFIRFKNRITKGAYNNINSEQDLPNKYIFVPLQLENDTQILIHSTYKSNQYIISEIENKFTSEDVVILFKKHPNDNNDYLLGKKSRFTFGSITSLSENAFLSITVNSSAAIDIIKTECPLFLLGDSIYNKDGVALKVDLDSIFEKYIQIGNGVKFFERSQRDKFLYYLKNIYSVHGAGFSYDTEEVKRVLKLNGVL